MKSIEQFHIETIEIAGLTAVLQALRLPYKKECRSDASHHYHERKNGKVNYSTQVKLADEDRTLLSTLVKRGDEHAKVLRGMVVYAEINAPRYLWQEIDTYRIGKETLASESTMHSEVRGLSDDELVKAKEEITEGLMQKRIVMFAYQTLRRIYFQRRNHRLPQWRLICKWIESLPLAKEFIIIEN